MVCFKQLYFLLSFPENIGKKYQKNGMSGTTRQAFLHEKICIYIFIFLFKLRESLALCMLSKFFSKYYFFFTLWFSKLEFTEVGKTWRCEPINGVWMGGAAYVSPNEYINTAYFCSYRVIWVVTRKRSTRSNIALFYYHLGSGLSPQSCS